MKTNKFLPITFIFSLILAVAIAAPPDLAVAVHPTLGSTEITAVSAENGVRLWASRREIFMEKNGSIIKSYTSDNSPIEPYGSITAAAICDDIIWLIQNGKIFKLPPNSAWEVIDSQRFDELGLVNRKVKGIAIAEGGYLWFAHERSGASLFVELVNPRFAKQAPPLLHREQIHKIYIQQTHLWFAMPVGVARLRTEIESDLSLNLDIWKGPEFPANSSFSFAEIGHKGIAVATDVGIALYDQEYWKIFSADDGVKVIPATQMQKISDDYIVLGGAKGLQLWSINHQGDLMTHKDGLPSDRISSIHFDSDTGEILVGTARGAAILQVQGSP